MLCRQCQQEIEDGAAFCGNCGQPTGAKASVHTVEMHKPQYAIAKAPQHAGEMRSIVSVIIGVIGIPAAIMPIAGITLGIVGLILGTITRRSHKRTASTVGIIFSCIAILVSLGVWAYTLTHEKELSKFKNRPSGETSAIVATSLISTPCYNIQFAFTLNTDHDAHDNCDVRVFEGPTIEVSNNVYKVYGNKVLSITPENFPVVAKEAIEKDISTTLPSFTISGGRFAQFAGSPAYIVNAEDKQSNIAVVEAAVFHESKDGYNLFSIVHATKGSTTNLKDLEDSWQWK